MNAILASELPSAADTARARMTAAYCRDETEAVNDLLVEATLPVAERDLVLARHEIGRAREHEVAFRDRSRGARAREEA